MDSPVQSLRTPTRLRWKLLFAIALSLLFVVAALLVGWMHGRRAETLPLIGISVLLEAQPAAAASIPLGFKPIVGGTVSILANFILLPILAITIREISTRWKWVSRKIQKGEKHTAKFSRFGVWMFVLLSPFLGAYLCLAIGLGLRWPQVRVMTSITAGMIVSTLFVAYGGHFGVQAAHSPHVRHIGSSAMAEIRAPLHHLNHFTHRVHRWTESGQDVVARL